MIMVEAGARVRRTDRLAGQVQNAKGKGDPTNTCFIIIISSEARR
jgi:hypothetical protein